MSPFRIFGRAPEPEPEPASAAADDATTWAPGPWSADPAPATRHARPVAFGRGLHRGGVDDDPPTDPHGFPPVPAEPAAGRWPVPRRPVPPDPHEASALAAAFAADYLSWDEVDPLRRGRALADHLAAPGDAELLGWDGRGRQRAEFALPGLVRPDGDDRVLVDVRVRVTPYREVGDRTADRAAEAAEAADEPDVPGTQAAAPAPTGRGWRGCASYWVRLSVPVVREDGRLVVDAADEAEPDPGDEPVVAEVHELPITEPPEARDPLPVHGRVAESAW
jgi:hypothetical protein